MPNFNGINDYILLFHVDVVTCPRSNPDASSANRWE